MEKSKKSPKAKVIASKKQPHKISLGKEPKPKKDNKQNKQEKNIQKKKKTPKKQSDFEAEREKILAELTDDEYEELFYGNDIENMPHDIFDIYDEPVKEKRKMKIMKKV